MRAWLVGIQEMAVVPEVQTQAKREEPVETVLVVTQEGAMEGVGLAVAAWEVEGMEEVE